jgi:cyclophilin family peptidyl-prolyl cis-trans isomerase
MKKNTILLLLSIFAIAVISGCIAEEDVQEKTQDKGDETMDETKQTVAVIETSKGAIEIQLNAEKAPISVKNFLSYVNEGFYDGTIFHRVMPGFMVQGGGFTPDGNQKETKAPIKLESDNGLKNTIGTLAMARTNVPDSATSQFFINVADNGFLNNAPGNDGYAVFGEVISGMEVVNEIVSVPTTNNGPNANWPVDDILIEKVYVKE